MTFFLLTSVDGKASNYFEELKSIESNILNDIGASKERITKIEKDKEDFTEEELALYYVTKGHLEIINTNFPEAIIALKKVIESNPDSNFKGRAHSLLAAAFIISGRHEETYHHLDKALSFLKDMDNKRYKATILSNALNNYNDLGMLDYGMHYARRLLKLGEKNEDMVQQCFANIEIALIEIGAENILLARERLSKVKSNCNEVLDTLILLNIPAIEAKLALKAGNIEKAQTILELNYPKIKSFGWGVLTSIVETDLADTYHRLGKNEKAQEFAQLGYEKAKNNNDLKRQKNAAKVLGLALTELKQESEALYYFKKYAELEQELNTSLKQRKLAYEKSYLKIRSNQK